MNKDSILKILYPTSDLALDIYDCHQLEQIKFYLKRELKSVVFLKKRHDNDKNVVLLNNKISEIIIILDQRKHVHFDEHANLINAECV